MNSRMVLAALLGLGLGFSAYSAPEDSDGLAERERALAATKMIDARIDSAISAAELEPAPSATEEEIVRRLSLDLNGVIPPAELVSYFVKKKDKALRTRAIETMIRSPLFNRHFANVFADAWVDRKDRGEKGGFINWIASQLAVNRPFDEICRDVIQESGPAGFFARRWGRDPVNMAAQTPRVFMGLQIQCAQCHNHPFTEWKQEQFHHFAAYFAEEGKTYSYELKGTGEQTSFEPRFLFPDMGSAKAISADESLTQRQKIAKMMTDKENPYFARMTVNRVWKAMFGRGLVEPAEDLEGSQGYHPLLLSFLAQDFIAAGWDIRHLVRAIVYSRAYQRSSQRPTSQKDPAREFERLQGSKDEAAREKASLAAQQEVWLFARASLRPLSPKQIVASLLRLTDQEPAEARLAQWRKDDDKDEKKDEKMGAGKDPKSDPKSDPKKDEKKAPNMDAYNNAFNALYRTFDDLYGDEEVNGNPDAFDGTVPQALTLFNGRQINDLVKPKKDSLLWHTIYDRGVSEKTMIHNLFMIVLSRPPSSTETRLFGSYFKKGGAQKIETAEDLIWALINSSDFLMNH